MKRLFIFCILFFSFYPHITAHDMTKEEVKLIRNAGADQPMRVLLVTNEQDSAFLRKKCSDVDSIENNQDLQYFIERLQCTLDAEMGVGIAAPQVGVGINLFLFARLDKEGYPVEVVINPRITGHSEEIICFEDDGCLSIPGFSGNSKRWPWVDVEYRNEKNELIKERLEGYSREGNFTGIIFQHEFDHLQGILFTDKLCEEE